MFLAEQKEPLIIVPRHIGAILDMTISLRESFSGQLSAVLDDSKQKQASDSRHAYFLAVLKAVRTILSPRLAKVTKRPTKKAKNFDEIVNQFEHLEIEEPTEAFEHTPTTSPSNVPVNAPRYTAERPSDDEERWFAFYLLINDLNKLRAEVSHAWEGFKKGGLDLTAVSLTTNTAVDLARSMVEDLGTTCSKFGGAHTMLQTYCAAAVLANTPSSSKLVAPDEKMYLANCKTAEALFWPASQLLVAFCDVLEVNPNPDMKRGYYGKYEPMSDRSCKSNSEQFREDKVLLLEMLPEFLYYCRSTKEPPPVEDELSRGLRAMFTTKEVGLPLVFAATLFLDIHHILRDHVAFGYQKLRQMINYVEVDLKEEIGFHKNIESETWPNENDLFIQNFVDTVSFWCVEDQQLAYAKRVKRPNLPQQYQLYLQHPWLCGMWRYYSMMRFHEISIVYVNAWGAVMSCAHFYNAVLKSKHTEETMWKDMEVAIMSQDSATFFTGEAPKSMEDCLKRYAIATGASAANLAKSTRKKRGLVLSKKGPKGLKELGTLLQLYKGRFCDGNGQINLKADDVQKVLELSSWEYELDEHGNVMEMYRDNDTASKKKQLKHLSVSKLLGLLRDTLNSETIEVCFDYLRLHRQCWRLLRQLRDHCRDDLIKMYGPAYIEKESQLPFIVGYILMSGMSSQQVGELMLPKMPGVVVTSGVVEGAKYVLDGLIGSGAGALITDAVLPKALDLEIGFEYE
jgi:hypothetical protein